MKLRVIVGSSLVERYRHSRDLKNIYSSRSLLIQADSSIKAIEVSRQMKVLFMGSIVGRRNTEGSLCSIRSFGSGTKSFLASKNIVDCIKQLKGRFILVRISEGDNLEICADRFGQLDVYYQRIDRGAVFASELSLLPFKDGSVKYDSVGLAHSLYIYGFRPAKRHTLYEGVKRLGVGEFVRCQNSRISFIQMQHVMPTMKEYGKKELKRYTDTLLDAIEKRCSSGGNIVFLSSGWDSTAMLACLVKILGPKKVTALIGRFHFSQRAGVINEFELKRAKAVADYFKVKLHITEIDHWRIGPEIVERWQDFMRSHMFSGMSFYLWARLSEYIVKSGIGKTIFSGEISDGAHNFGFSQFTTLFHPVLEFREYSDKMAAYLFGPNFYRQISAGTFSDDVIYKLIKAKYSNGIFDVPSKNPLERNFQLIASMFIRDNRIPFWSLNNSRIFTEHGRRYYNESMKRDYFDEAAESMKAENLYSWYVHLYNSFHWQGGTVLSMAVTAHSLGLDVNLPFYDSRLQEFFASMPESWGRGLEIRPTKYPLKWMLENEIDYPMHLQVGPHSYLYDVIPNFNIAGEFIYASAYTPVIKECLKKRSYRDLLPSDVFNLEYFDRIVDNYLKNKEVPAERNDLSSLAFLTLTGWY